MEVSFDVLLGFLPKKSLFMESVINGNELFDCSVQLMSRGKANKKNPTIFIDNQEEWE